VDSIVQIYPGEKDDVLNTSSAEQNDEKRYSEQGSAEEREKFIKDVQLEIVSDNVSPSSKQSPSASLELKIVEN
jgi:hypothetical protein